jgi:hypothetical protein
MTEEEAEGPSIDQEWLELHQWTISFRNQAALSISNFLKLCSLEVDSKYFRQHVGAYGRNLRPANKKVGSKGRELRDKIKDLKLQTETQPQRVTPIQMHTEESLPNLLFDWKAQNIDAMRQNGVSDISCDIVEDLVTLIYHLYDNCSLMPETVTDWLLEDLSIKSFLQIYRLSVRIVKCQRLISTGVSKVKNNFATFTNVLSGCVGFARYQCNWAGEDSNVKIVNKKKHVSIVFVGAISMFFISLVTSGIQIL